jgi:phenylacetate-CoA ligase
MTRRYWNEEIETLPQADIARLEAERLPAQLSYLAANSDFFRAKFDQGGLAPEAVKGREELARLPFTEKRELAAAQADGSLIGANLCASLEEVARTWPITARWAPAPSGRPAAGPARSSWPA